MKNLDNNYYLYLEACAEHMKEAILEDNIERTQLYSGKMMGYIDCLFDVGEVTRSEAKKLYRDFVSLAKGETEEL